MIVIRNCEKFQSCVWKLTKGSVFMNGLIHDGDAFIVLFEADVPVVDN